MPDLTLHQRTEPEPLPPELTHALQQYAVLKERCDFKIPNSGKVNGREVDPIHFTGRPSDPSIAHDDLVTLYPHLLSEKQRQALIEGMPKLMEAFERVGFPKLSMLAHKNFTTGSFTPLRFKEFRHEGMGRHFSSQVSLIEDDAEQIYQVLKAKMDNSRFVSSTDTGWRGFMGAHSERVEEARTVDALVQAEQDADRVDALRQQMRTGVIDGGASTPDERSTDSSE